jgi:hypothetical protein
MVTRGIAVVWLLSLALCEHVFSIPLFIPDRGYPSFHPRSGISLFPSPIRDIPLFILDPGYPLSVIIRDRRALADSCDAQGKARASTTIIAFASCQLTSIQLSDVKISEVNNLDAVGNTHTLKYCSLRKGF